MGVPENPGQQPNRRPNHGHDSHWMRDQFYGLHRWMYYFMLPTKDQVLLICCAESIRYGCGFWGRRSGLNSSTILHQFSRRVVQVCVALHFHIDKTWYLLSHCFCLVSRPVSFHTIVLFILIHSHSFSFISVHPFIRSHSLSVFRSQSPTLILISLRTLVLHLGPCPRHVP